MVFKVKVLPLKRLYPYRKPRWAEVGQTYIHTRRNCTLWFWQCKNLAVRAKVVKNKATGTPHEVYCIQPSLALDDSIAHCQECFIYTYTGVGLSALYQRCTLKDDISYLLPTWLSAGTWKLKRKHHFIGWQERTNKMKNKSCATNFATQQPFSLLLLLQEPFLLAERKKMCYLSMAANQSQYTNINSFILGYIY